MNKEIKVLNLTVNFKFNLRKSYIKINLIKLREWVRVLKKFINILNFILN